MVIDLFLSSFKYLHNRTGGKSFVVFTFPVVIFKKLIVEFIVNPAACWPVKVQRDKIQWKKEKQPVNIQAQICNISITKMYDTF